MNDSDVAVLVSYESEHEERIDAALLRRAVVAALSVAADDRPATPGWGRDGGMEVSIRIGGDESIQELNRSYRGVDRPTDVLSFSLDAEQEGPEIRSDPDMPHALGDVVISYPYATRQARELGHEVEMEMSWLTIHGTLQLLGYGHETDPEAEHMEALERQALAAIGFHLSPPG